MIQQQLFPINFVQSMPLYGPLLRLKKCYCILFFDRYNRNHLLLKLHHCDRSFSQSHFFSFQHRYSFYYQAVPVLTFQALYKCSIGHSY